MEAGCFSRLINRPLSKSKKITAEYNHQSDHPIPTIAEYGKEGGKQVVRVLESAAGLIPIPYVQQALQVALKIVEACEDVSAIEQQVLQLQDRVCRLMMAIVEHITEGPSADSIRDAGKTIEGEINALNGTLSRIVEDLNEIKQQNRWLLFFFKDLNKTKVNECMDRLTTSMELFKVSSELHTADSLRKVQLRLEDIQRLTEQVSKQVSNLDSKVDTGIATIMDALNGAKARKATLLLAQQPMPLKPRIFHGRNDFVEDIAHLLIVERTSRVCILGPGGMGKTSLALAVVESPIIQRKFPERNQFWIPCIEATSITLFLQMLYTNLHITRDTKDQLNDILFELAASDEPRLILLDNFETPWNLLDGTRDQLNHILCRLVRFNHVSLLVTMRGTYPPSEDIEWQHRNLPPTDAEACRQIFHDIHPSAKGDPHLDDLLKAIGYMPFAVTLMATLAKESQSPAKDLLDLWSRKGTDMLSDSPSEKSMNKSISLSVDSTLMKQNPDALTLLATLAMLPAGTTRQRLNDWAPSLESLPQAIAILSKAGLLMVNDGPTNVYSTLFALPVVQSYMLLHNRISSKVEQIVRRACCSYVLAHRSRTGDPNFEANTDALGVEDTNIQSIFQGIFSSTKYATTETLESFLAFNWHLHDTKPNVALATQALEISRTAGNQKFMAESHFCLGSTYLKLNRYDHCKADLQQACYLFRDLSNSEPKFKLACLSGAGRCSLALAECMMYLLEPSYAIFRVLEVAGDDFAVAGDVHGQALLLVRLGIKHGGDGDYTSALIFLEEGRARLQKLNRMVDLSRCLASISKMHYKARDYPMALEAGEQALKFFEGLDLRYESEHLHADITQALSMVLTRLGQTTRALEYAKISLVDHEITQQPLGVAQLWEQIGFIYLLQSKFEDALAAYEAAFDIWSSLGTIEMASTGKALCSTNIEKIKLKQQDPTTHVALCGTDLDRSFGYAQTNF